MSVRVEQGVGSLKRINGTTLNTLERRSIATLSTLIGLRMFGLFLILPVFALYAPTLQGATPQMVGLALGAYGLTQALLQVPFGLLSDRYGRKLLLTVGLLLFALGSFVAAMSSSIEGVILGRALQGSGAISAVILATLADLTREQQRTKAMAVVGVSIGFSFVLALMLGPVLGQWAGLSGLFWITAWLAVAVLPLVWWTVPAVNLASSDPEVQPVRAQARAIFFNAQLLRLDIGIFILHMLLTALFIAVPFAVRDTLGLGTGQHWQVYVPVLLCSGLAMVPLLIYGMRRRQTFRVFRLAIVILLAAEILLAVGSGSAVLLVGSLWLFFVGFNLLEAMLPSLMSRLAPAASKGTALGIYNTFQFAGVFAGGIAGGFTYGLWGGMGVFVFACVSIVLWLVVALTGPVPALLESLTVRLEHLSEQEVTDIQVRLRRVTGVHEIVVLPGRYMAYLKVDPDLVDHDALKNVDGVITAD